MSSKEKSSLSRTWSRTKADTDPPGCRQTFEPRRDIDAVAVDVLVVDDDVADVEPDPEFDPPFDRFIGIALGHLALDIDRAAHRIDNTGKLDEQPVAGGLDDAPAMLSDLRIAQFAPDRH